MKRSVRLFLLALLATAKLLSAHGVEPGKPWYRNPVLAHGADPWIVKHEEFYYYCCADRGGGICISRSDKLHVINPVRRVWTPEPGAWNSTCVWAPELHRWNGRWYIFYAAGRSGPPYIHQRAGVLESAGDDPLSEYTDKGMVYTGDSLGHAGTERWAIDMTLFEHEGMLYAVWSGWEADAPHDKTRQHLYIARMENPWTAATNRVKISSPDLPYELNGKLPINEGPQVLRNGADVFIVYSCGQSWLSTYKLSSLRLRPGADPLAAQSWQKSPASVFEGTDRVHGPGHACFTTSPDGTENYIVYHAKKDTAPGWARDVRIQRFTFGPDGAPLFGAPLPVETKLPLPSGTP